MLLPDWPTLQTWLELMLKGLVVTIQLSAVSIVFTIVIGFIASIGAVSPRLWVRIVTRIYVDLFRSIPILALMIIFYFGFGPYSAELGLNSFTFAAAALSLSSGAYLAEVYRAAIQSVPRSQWRAAESLGLGHGTILRHAIIPQVIPPLVPATLNIVITIVKNSSLASLITVYELTLSATLAVSTSFMPMQVFLLLGIFYAAVILPMIFVSGRLERWVNRRYGLISAKIPATATAGRSYSLIRTSGGAQ